MRSRTIKEMVSGLRRRGYPPQIAEEVARELADAGLLDDGLLARDMVLRGRGAGKSRARIYAELRARGITREVAEETLDDCYDRESERDAAMKALSGMLGNPVVPPAEHEIKSAVRKLSARGFSSYAISGALRGMRRVLREQEDLSFLDTDGGLS